MTPNPNQTVEKGPKMAPDGGGDSMDRRMIVKSRSLSVVRPVDSGLQPEKTKSVSNLVGELLSDIYGKSDSKRGSTATTGGEWSWHDSDNSRPGRETRVRSNLKQIEIKCWSRDVKMLKEEIAALESLVAQESNNLIKYLKKKDQLLLRREAHYDVITAVIHAISSKTREDMKMKFSLAPGTETGFSQWLDAMKMVAQLPGGVPPEFRTKLWLQLSERHLNDQNIDWEKAESVIFNEWTNPDDEELGVQIVKDLHRTGCSLFCGAQEQNQALLKRVLLAYARWNKNVGYCQGFNMLAALILQVMDRDEKNAVKVMIYLIEGVLPESYFANNLRGLSVDMAVFRDLLRLRLPKLSKHLEALQNDTNAGTSYEPPLTNVFTMQWFLTLFSNCLPQQTVLRVWDLVFLHGNEVLLRTALAIWGILQDRIISVESADEFYSIMGVVTREMLEFGLMDANNLVKAIVMVDPFPNELQELRGKYLYNISPWTQSVQSAARKGIKLFYSDPEDQDDTEDEDKIALATAYGVFRRRESGSREVQPIGPTLDISVLKQQYAKLRQRQRQAHIIISAACSSNLPANLASVPSVSVNHLLMGKSALVNKGRRIGPPEGSIPPPKNRIGKAIENHKQLSKKGKIVISGETLEWKDAEKGKCSSRKENKISNTDNKIIGNKIKNASCNGLNSVKIVDGSQTRGRVEHTTDIDNGDSLFVDDVQTRTRSSSSASSTSTELCDEDMHRYSDFDSEEGNMSDASARKSEAVSEEFSDSVNKVRLMTENLSSLLTPERQSEAEDEKEVRKIAEDFVRQIEQELQVSDRLKHLRGPQDISPKHNNENNKNSNNGNSNNNSNNNQNNNSDRADVRISPSSSYDNINIKNKFPIGGRDKVEKEFEKFQPEVPIDGKNVIPNIENRIFDRSKVEEKKETEMEKKADEMYAKRDRDRRKSDLALSVIKENLEMLTKFSHKSSRKEESQGKQMTEAEKILRSDEIEGSQLSFVSESSNVKEEPPVKYVGSEETTRVKTICEEEKKSREAINENDRKKDVKKPHTEEMKDWIEEPPVRYVGSEKKTRVKTICEKETKSREAINENDRKKDLKKPHTEEMRDWVEEPPVRYIESEETTRVKTICEERTKSRETINENDRKNDLKEPYRKEMKDWVAEQHLRLNPESIRTERNQEREENIREIDTRQRLPDKMTISKPAIPDTQEDTEIQQPSPKAVSKVNKEVNTDITISADVETSPGRSYEVMHKIEQTTEDDFIIGLISRKSVQKSPDRFKPEKIGLRDPGIDGNGMRQYRREDLAERWKKESEKIESKIEMSKSDWDIKMKRIAELENTTREKLNEMKSRSIVHRHRSLDRYEGRARDRELRKSPVPRIQVPEGGIEDGELETRKKRISALSFDEITSRTEKLLGTSDKGLAPDSGYRKWRKSFDECPSSTASDMKSYEFYSSPTSPEYRPRKYTEFCSPKRYDASKWKSSQVGDDDWLTVIEENGKTKAIDIESSIGDRSHRSESESGSHLKSPTTFNPFPTRSTPKPKEIGVRLGMYPSEGAHSSKKP